MTLPQNVAVAVAEVDAWLSGESVHADWQAIRAHLMSQEAEIARLNAEWHEIFNRALLAESRLAAANALLQEAHGFIPVVYHSSGNPGLHYRIQTHLQGAGDEA